jgi:hypothetical protein
MDDYVKQLEAENEMLRRKIEMNPTLADIMKRYFCLSKETNRRGEVSYGLQLTSIAASNFLHEKDYEYLKSVGIHEEEVMIDVEFDKNVTVTNDDKLVNEILDDYYKSIKVPKEYMNGLDEPCPVKSIDDYTRQVKELLDKGLLDTPCE